MKKRKNKQSRHSQQKITKAQYRNEFLRKVKHILNVLTGSDYIYSQLPEFHKDWIFNNRSPATRVVAAAGQDISPSLIQSIAWVISEMTKNHTIEFMNSGTKISVHDFLTANITIFYYLQQIKGSENPKFQEISNQLKKHYSNIKNDLKAWNFLGNTLSALAIYNSDFNDRIYWFVNVAKEGIPGHYGPYDCMEMYCQIPEKIPVTIDGNTRPALRIGWGILHQGMLWATIKGSDFGLSGTFAQLPMNVYIQHHALNRLTERIDCIEKCMLHFWIFKSICIINTTKNKNGNILIEYRINDKKLGYLLTDIINGNVIIRTFLFITNNGTPEGEKLNADTGLNKEDHKYLMIDKLSTFMSSDIRNNQRIKEIFVRAGCASLFELDEKTISDKVIIETSPAKAMMQYLGLEIKNEPPPLI